jgi:hypothetical protein
MTWSVYGRGSWFAGAADPADIDVLVITDQPIDRAEAAAKVVPLLEGVERGLPLDVSVAHPDRLTVFERAAAQDGRLLEGEPVTLAPLRPVEWAWAMTRLAAQAMAYSDPAAAALNAVRAIWAGAGLVVVPKSAVVAAATGGPWESLTTAAWAHLHAATFDHPDLADALDGAYWAPAGEAATPEYERHGWSSKGNAAAVLTVYRQVLTADEITRVAAAPATDRQVGGWAKSPLDDPGLADCLALVTGIANRYWFHEDLAGLEPPDVHRHRPGDVFPPHVDRLPMCPTRAFNVVAMIQPAQAGGRLHLDLGGQPIRPDLAPGDIVIFDSSALHGVTTVETGERITLVSHAHAHRPGSA